MSVKSIEIKVSIICEKTKTCVLKVVSKLQGVDAITVNVEKGTVTIVGTVDPVCIVTQLRKAKICAEIISVGPPKKPEPKKPECKPDCKPVCKPDCKPVCKSDCKPVCKSDCKPVCKPDCKPHSCSCPQYRFVPDVYSCDSPYDTPGCRFW